MVNKHVVECYVSYKLYVRYIWVQSTCQSGHDEVIMMIAGGTVSQFILLVAISISLLLASIQWLVTLAK